EHRERRDPLVVPPVGLAAQREEVVPREDRVRTHCVGFLPGSSHGVEARVLRLDLDTDTEGSHVFAGYPGTMPAMRRILMLVTVVALMGCGEGRPMPEGAGQTLTRCSPPYKPVAAAMLATSEALSKGRLEPAETALESVR